MRFLVTVLLFFLGTLDSSARAQIKSVKILSVSARASATCVTYTDGLHCWGYNVPGELLFLNAFPTTKLVGLGRGNACGIVNGVVKCHMSTMLDKALMARLKNASQVELDEFSGCAIIFKKLECWGIWAVANVPQVPPEMEYATKVAVGFGYVCAVSSKQLMCWGAAVSGSKKGKGAPTNLQDVTDVAAQGNSTCAIAQKKVTCWGEITSPFITLVNPTNLTVGLRHACVIDNGEIRCWGSNLENQLGVPRGIKNPRKISAGFNHTCALSDFGVTCWGSNTFGESNVPNGLINPTDVVMNVLSACATSDFGVRCWGAGATLAAPVDLKNVIKLSMGERHACALADSNVRCWGYFFEQGPGFYHLTGVNIDYGNYLENVKELVSGANHVCALVKYFVKCWMNQEWKHRKKVEVPQDLSNPRGLSAAENTTCLITDLGVRCWGENAGIVSQIPTNLKDVTEVSVGASHACAIAAGEVVCWGDSTYHQLEVPGGLKNPRLITSARTGSCVDSDDGIYCWGWQDAGVTDRPHQFHKRSLDIVALKTDGRNYCAVTVARSLHCFGPSFTCNLSSCAWSYNPVVLTPPPRVPLTWGPHL